MPTYEYVCADCANHWEEIQKITESPIEVCPKCQKHAAKRQISGGNFILKGGGWYADLYSSPSAKKKPSDKSQESTAPSSGASSTNGSTETSTSSNTASSPSGASSSASSSSPSPGPSSASS